jgi:MinD superfamily P-loop ATPase
MSHPLRIAIASGKGGTGKTTIATNLAVALAETGARVAYVDCDVEEPNGHIFLRPTIRQRREVSIPVPVVDETRCTLCGACGQACRYSAILVLPKKVLTFPKLCHGCGGCSLACPEDAIREVPRVVGFVDEGFAGRVAFVQGTLDVGEAMAPPVIRAVLAAAPRDGTIVLDAPPGTSCPVIETVKTADVVLLVTEPTPFGLNDLELAVAVVRELGLPSGVVVNRAGTGDHGVFDYCAREHIPVLLEIPNDRAIAQAYSRGELAVTALPRLQPRFVELGEKLAALAGSAPRRSRRPRVVTPPTSADREGRPSADLPPGHAHDVRELVVVSGKGGTGKTSIVASFVALAAHAAVADCDVDAADLHLVLGPAVRHRWPFSGGRTAVIDAPGCTGCGLCLERCRFGAVRAPAGGVTAYEIDPISCEGCGVCADICPEQAVALVAEENGEWFVSTTRHGPMVHARLGIAQENSGKLVSLVRREAQALSISERRELLISDGSPGIACPVIASIAGARLVLIVTEPTLSGLHDLRRVADLCRQFNIETGVCINKADINLEVSDQIEAEAARRGIPVLGRIRYDDAVTTAQVKRRAVVEIEAGPAAVDIRTLWERVQHALAQERLSP